MTASDLRALLAHMPEGMVAETRKYKVYGEWTPWHVTDPAKALHRMDVRVDGYCPYEVRIRVL